MLIVKTWSVKEPSAGGGADRDIAAGPVGFAVDRAGHGHDARVGVDGEASAVVVRQAVGDRVGGGVRVAGRGRDAHAGADSAAFSLTALAAASLSVTAPTSNSSTSLMLIGKDLVGEGAVGEVARTGDIAAGPVGFAVDRAGHGHDARVGVDGEPSAVVVRPGCR